MVTEVESTALGDWTDMPPEDACVNYERCGNTIPTNESMCAECLDTARHNDETA